MKNWIVTGISGSGRIELLEELKKVCEEKGKKVLIHDVGALIYEEAKKAKIHLIDERVLNIDKNLLRALRESALKEVQLTILKNKNVDINLIGIHATFRWKNNLIEGLSYKNLDRFNIEGFINVVDDVKNIYEINSKNPKWNKDNLPSLELTQQWMIEEEFITQVLADFFNKPMFIIARSHRIDNLYDFFFENKKKIYLSYPITAIKEDEPDLLEKIQTEYLTELENHFVVFNPLSIKDMSLTYGNGKLELPNLIADITEEAKKLIKSRTVERDYHFIDQSDATVVFYPTNKLSPGVLAEIIYSHKNQKPVFIYFKEKASPFLEHYATYITDNLDDFFYKLKDFSKKNNFSQHL